MRSSHKYYHLILLLKVYFMILTYLRYKERINCLFRVAQLEDRLENSGHLFLNSIFFPLCPAVSERATRDYPLSSIAERSR